MALDPTPWGIGGGAVHQPETVRQALYDSTGGAEGVSSVGGLRVAPTATPGGNIRSLTGGALLLNRYPGGAGQTYSVRNKSQTEVPITATGSAAGRTDLVVLRVLDPQYEGEPPEDPTAFDYARFEVIEGVPAATETFKELNLDYPAIPLAKITIPKSTATITSGMIEDLREVAQPKKDTVMRTRATITSGEETLVAQRDNGEWFPNAGGLQVIDIPEWATRMQIEAEWLMIEEGAGNAWGDFWVEFGPGVGGANGTQDRQHSTQRYRWNNPDTADTKASTWKCADDVYIPAALRGTTQSFVMKANLSANFATSARPKITNMSGTILKAHFMQVADISTS